MPQAYPAVMECRHGDADRLLIAMVAGAIRNERITDEEKTAQLQSVTTDPHLLAHAAAHCGESADPILRAAGADMRDVTEIRARVVGTGLIAGLAQKLTASEGGTGPR